MIEQFTSSSALLLIDVQKGVDVLQHWGGPSGRRNNLHAEANQRRLLDAWRQHKLLVFYTMHDSREQKSPLKIALPTGAIKEGLEPGAGDVIIRKDVNSGFIGTNLEITLRRHGIKRLIIAGFFTNMCVETTARTAGNSGFDTYVVHDACATTNRMGPDGVDHEPELVHAMSIANLHGEFCTAICTADAIELLNFTSTDLHRSQGNE